MTAINVIRHSDAVHVLTDGASWSADGECGFAGSKIWPLADRNAVITARGPKLAPALLAEVFSAGGRTYDEMKCNSVELVRRAVLMFGDLWAFSPTGADIEVVVAGWSEKSGPDSYVVCTNDRNPAVTPWTVAEAGPVLMTPGDRAIEDKLRAILGPEIKCADDLDPERDGLRMLQAQRDMVLALPKCGVDFSVVGAFAQLTTVTRQAIMTKILHRWPDEVLEPAAALEPA
jgi:hypothetical protein